MFDGENDDFGDQMRSKSDKITLEGHEFRPAKVDRNKYGNMKVLYDQGCLVTLGPDYWCFLPTFIVFSTISILMIKLVLTNNNNIYFQAATIFICGGMCLSYLAVATSNPGIVTEDDISEEEEEQNPMNRQNLSQRKRLCRRCNLMVRRGTYHCRDCDVCVQGYDHHCPWTSKCIGSGNLIRFYIFLGFVPVYLVYVFVAFAAVMSTIAMQTSTVHVRHH